MKFVVAVLGAAVGTWLLSQWALRIGWVDQRAGQEHRKLLRRPVALVGGAAILFAVLLAITLAAFDSAAPMRSLTQDLRGMAWPGLLGAFILGLIDDIVPRGLTAQVKFGGQLLVAALVALFPGSIFVDASGWECMALGALALVAMNAVNLFDHADGLVGLLLGTAMLAGKAPLAPLFGAASAGYLPFNLFIRRPGEEPSYDAAEDRTHSAPLAMLGDSGSHLAGVLIATTPGAWWFLALPLLDMVRVVLGRLRRGRRFWAGDRTHLGHLLHGIGFSPVTSALLVGTLLLPILVTVVLMDGAAPLVVGLLSTGALYCGMLVMADHALGDGPQREREFEALATTESREANVGRRPRAKSRGDSVSDVFARASGTEEEPSLSDRILKPLRRRDAGERKDMDLPDPEPSAGSTGGRASEPSDDPFVGPPEGSGASSGPFAEPSSSDATGATSPGAEDIDASN